ncbi:MAG: hypothetical protein RBS08_00035 [Bdellovibrionales bacterium]|jgi:hypothetical protein|nr:hypothetical protein [Bdellovibrionales bacterium]
MNQIIVEPDKQRSLSTPSLDSATQERVQEIYERLTKRPLLKQQKYNKPFQFTFEQINQLHMRIVQKAESHMADLRTLEVTVSYLKDGGTRFNSLDDFLRHSKSNQEAIKNIELLYHFIFPARDGVGVKTAEVTIDLYSLIAVNAEIKDQQFFLDFFGFFDNSASIRIEHDSYPIAESFVSVFDKWIQVLPTGEVNKIYNWLSRRINFVRLLSAILVLGCFPMIMAFMPYPVVAVLDFKMFCVYGAAVFSAVFVGARVSDLFSEYILKDLKTIWPLGYIRITDGDEKLIRSVEEKNRKSTFFTVKGLLPKFFLMTLSTVYMYLLTLVLTKMLSD